MALVTGEMFKHLSDVLDDTDVKKLQKVFTGVLKDIVEVCNKENIDWTTSGGVCLGAIRHQGFIPWDDDLDINVARYDFERFMKGMDAQYPDKYWLQFPRTTKDYALGMGRLRLKGTSVRQRDDFSDIDGAPVDVFIVENVPNNPILRKIHGLGSLAFGLISSTRRFAEHEDAYKSIVAGNAEAEKSVKKKAFIGHIFGFRSSDAWTATWDKWNALCKNNKSEYVTIPTGRKHYFGELYKRSDFFPTTEGTFEGLSVPLPAHPEVYMNALYGPDYMTPPKVEDREKHVVLKFDLGKYDEGSEEQS